MEDYRRWNPGTVLVLESNFPGALHFLMVEYLDFNTGIEWAIHNMPGVGVTWVPLDEAIAGKRVKACIVPSNPEEAIARMQSLIGHPYDLIQANCEHVIRWAVTGVWESKQVSGVMIALLIAGAAVALKAAKK
jgi:hypothetical protein